MAIEMLLTGSELTLTAVNTSRSDILKWLWETFILPCDFYGEIRCFVNVSLAHDRWHLGHQYNKLKACWVHPIVLLSQQTRFVVIKAYKCDKSRAVYFC